ncbi:MAG: hypothetical protein K9J37_09775 [Saprospiraceae bacterium]|nr:hypothetical protein [Saprospiraceae bacterium]MCF8250192.1 hypothetical protein [Saprospiraceae bacterium]MCF8280045.1 hypothetical protein [Bacteroidales bacterium]MCF8312000.1 hypothetical protein [Saprospiraceae bacterium]MCF8441097.1 hypothetical protein [Saprospiraceae bacterium]
MKRITNKTKTNNIANRLKLVIAPLLVGTAVYRFFRSKRPSILGESPALYLSKNIFLQSAPSFLWSFALASALLLIWKPATKVAAFSIAVLTALVSVLFEFWQAANLGSGTFDWNDCLFSMIGCLISTLVFQKMMVNENLD